MRYVVGDVITYNSTTYHVGSTITYNSSAEVTPRIIKLKIIDLYFNPMLNRDEYVVKWGDSGKMVSLGTDRIDKITKLDGDYKRTKDFKEDLESLLDD